MRCCEMPPLRPGVLRDSVCKIRRILSLHSGFMKDRKRSWNKPPQKQYVSSNFENEDETKRSRIEDVNKSNTCDQTDLVNQGINFIDCEELASLLTFKYSSFHCIPLILDIRSLASQAILRIQTAVGIPCESRVKLRRAIPMLNKFLQEREKYFCTQDLENFPEYNRLIIIYTDSDINQFPLLKELLRSLIKHLVNTLGLDARVLKGGFREFQNSYKHLCEHPSEQTSVQHVDDTSPSTENSTTDKYHTHSKSDRNQMNDYIQDTINNNFSDLRMPIPQIKTMDKNDSSTSPLLLSGLGINISLIPTIEDVPCKSRSSPTLPKLMENASNKKNETDSISSKWDFFRLCLSDEDSGDPKDVFRAKASMIFPFLYLGNEYDALDEKKLNEHQIKSILNITLKSPFPNESNYKCCRIPAIDSSAQDLRSFLPAVFDFIEEARTSGNRVLIHCQAGVSRSPALVIAYLMAHSNFNLLEAYQFVKSKRSVISPNFAFLGQLLEFETEINSGHVKRKPDILESYIKSSPLNYSKEKNCA